MKIENETTTVDHEGEGIKVSILYAYNTRKIARGEVLQLLSVKKAAPTAEPAKGKGKKRPRDAD